MKLDNLGPITQWKLWENPSLPFPRFISSFQLTLVSPIHTILFLYTQECTLHHFISSNFTHTCQWGFLPVTLFLMLTQPLYVWFTYLTRAGRWPWLHPYMSMRAFICTLYLWFFLPHHRAGSRPWRWRSATRRWPGWWTQGKGNQTGNKTGSPILPANHTERAHFK